MSLEGLGENAKACLSYAELTKEFPSAPAHIQQALARERARAELRLTRRPRRLWTLRTSPR